MSKKDMQLWELTIESVTAAAALVIIGMQLYCGYRYESGFLTMVYRLLPLVLLYAGMTVLQIFPELLNGAGSEPLQGTVRKYAIRMVRNIKFLLVLGLLAPSAADVLGIRMDAAYSLLILAGILGNIGYYIFRIYLCNKKNNTKKKGR